jgi:hypothetical protein
VAYRFVAGQRPRSEQRDNGCYLVTVGKHINNIRAISRKPPITTTDKLLETVFSARSVQSGYKEDNFEHLHRDPTSCRGRRKGKSQNRDSKIWSRAPRDSDPRKTALAKPAAYTQNRPVLSSERAPHKNKTVTVKQ